MPLQYTAWADWVRASESEARLTQFSRGDNSTTHPNVEAAEREAAEEMLGFLGKRYGDAPLTNISPLTKSHLVNLGLWHLTTFTETRPDSIGDSAKVARAWLANVSHGNFVLQTSSGAKAEALGGLIFSSPNVTVRNPFGYVFDEDNPLSLFSRLAGPPL